MNRLKLAYFGTPDFAADFLEKLVTDTDIPVDVVAVVTQPDKPVGRKGIVTPTPVKVIAQKHHISVVDASEVKDVDLALLYAYGEMISAKLLKVPKHGFWNIHPSLLPLYRGASPISMPIINGDAETGVTLMKMDEELDHGPIIAQEMVGIEVQDRRFDLERKLTDVAYGLFKIAVKKLPKGTIKYTEQDHSKATYTERLTKQDGYVELSRLKAHNPESDWEIFTKFRGLYPWPGIWTTARIKDKEARIKITDVGFERGKLEIKKVQLEGKNEVDFDTFNKAYQVF